MTSTGRPSGSLSKAIERAGSALSDNSEFIASLERYWRSAVPEIGPADALGCSDDAWYWIAICRRPRPDRFAEDVRTIAGAADVDWGKLQHFIVTALAAERFRGAPADAQQAAGDLLAARARDDNGEQ
jgi:hypothetical protein